MRDIVYCDVCGELIREHSDVYIPYVCRYWRKFKITVCKTCEPKLTPETEDDIPDYVKE